MATVNLTKDTFEETIVDNDIVLVDFWADWCGPCKSFAPTYEKVSESHEGVVFAKVDTEAEQELASYFQIRSIPTLMIFRDQIGIFSQPGALPENALEDLIEQAKGLDMDAVRKEIEEQSAERTRPRPRSRHALRIATTAMRDPAIWPGLSTSESRWAINNCAVDTFDRSTSTRCRTGDPRVPGSVSTLAGISASSSSPHAVSATSRSANSAIGTSLSRFQNGTIPPPRR